MVIVRYGNTAEWILPDKIMLLMNSRWVIKERKINASCWTKVEYLNANSLEKSIAGMSGCPNDSHKKANIFIG